MNSCATMLLTAMDVEESAVSDTIQLPKEVTQHFLPCTVYAVVGLIGETPVLLIRMKAYGSMVRGSL